MPNLEERTREIADKVAVVTTTFYKPEESESDRIRAGLALESITAARNLGYEVVVVDGGTPGDFRNRIVDTGAHLLNETKKGMGPSRRQTMQIGYDLGKEVIAWTEPEKVGYIPQLVKTAEPILDGSADITIGNRGDLDSYPPMQKLAEETGNLFWEIVTETELDMWSGLRTFHRDAAHYFLDYNRTQFGDKWDSIFLPVIDAIKDRKKVISVDIDYTHPPEQTRIEVGNPEMDGKRIAQLHNLTFAIDSRWRKID